MKFNPLFITAPLVLALAACSSDSNYDFEASKDAVDAQIIANSSPQALFSPDPAAPVLPFPTNLFFQGSTDGTLNIPLGAGDDTSLANPVVALNQVDGFSTVAPIVTPVSEPLNAASLRVGDTIRVYEVSTQAGLAVTAIQNEVDNPQLLVAREIGSQLVLIPTVPLKPKTDYLVVLTNGITDVDDNPLQASLVYGLLKGDTAMTNPSLEGLRQATATHLAAVQAFSGISPENIALSWTFRTQSIREVLQAVKDNTVSSPLVLGPAGATTAAVPGLQGKADIFLGTLDVPYYLTAVSDENSAVDAINGFWTNQSGQVVGAIGDSGAPDYLPQATATETIPVIMTVPNASSAGQGSMPAGGWPVTIFQHGITGNRTQMLALADAMADAGRVLIAIDMPLHGLTDTASPFHADNTPFAERERTFNIDLAVNAPADGEAVDPNAPTSGPDQKTDSSGTHFINLMNLANSRDNNRQAVADLLVLSASLASAQGVQLNTSNLTFVGHSLGGIVGTVLLSYDSSFQAATLAMPGAGIAQLLANSETFGPVINAGLAGVGIVAGSADYNSFLTAAQTLVDSSDPINHATTLAANGSTRLHMIEVIGDAVIPNSVATAPLAGTEPLARLLGLTQVDATTTVNALVKFTEGSHGSILSPEASVNATVEMQRQTAGFAVAQGAQLTITNSDVIMPVQ